MTILLLMVISTIGIASMFWYPAMEPGYLPAPQYRPTKRERFITRIGKMIDEKHYSLAAEMLAKTKYDKASLPLDYWKGLVLSDAKRIENESKQLAQLKNLEMMLDA